MTGQTYTINGVKVVFPVKAYPSQLALMNKIIRGLDRRENCLLESPTGSGKSLALLCSSLAWQAAERRKADEECRELEQDEDDCCQAPTVTEESPANVITIDASDDEDFQTSSKPKKISQPPDIEEIAASKKKLSDDCCKKSNDNPIRKRKVPKIYFGTRTHKQIAQICRELGRTEYKHVRMCILSSREHTCIDPEVSSLPKKNEECKNKMDGPGCRFFDRAKKISHASMRDNGLHTAYDLEEFVGFCKKHKACPYFASRGIKDSANIVFCPYNYLIDPAIRERMEISLKDQVVILDEAHNVEDSSREAASFSLEETKLMEALNDINHMIEWKIKLEQHLTLSELCENMNGLLEKHRDSVTGPDYDRASRVWAGVDMMALFEFHKITEETIKKCAKAVSELLEEEMEDRQKQAPIHKLKGATYSVIEGLILVFKNIFRENMKYSSDYRLSLGKSIVYTEVQTGTPGRWLSKKRRPQRAPTSVFTLHFWCMNPSVSFGDVGTSSRCVILTSGTLSPMASFQSELGVPFPIQLEANHVIDKSQTWIGAVSKGPGGSQLLGTYQVTETLAYQDDIGRLTLEVCKTIPHGVLCFLPSYKSLNKLVDRWKSIGLWDQISEVKQVLTEPRSSDKRDFEETISEFYDCIENCDPDSGGITGALFIAVCRGKVSEGLDFADNNARAVITVGIPFPNYRDKQIELKQKYNDQNQARGLLRGREWYEIQAFRALNQALGRCIRHKNDWGALIMVDERFAKTKRYIGSLSKWIRGRVQYHGMFNQAQQSLARFTQDRINHQTLESLGQENTTCTEESADVTGFENSFMSTGTTVDNLDHSHQTPATPQSRYNPRQPLNSLTPIGGTPLNSHTPGGAVEQQSCVTSTPSAYKPVQGTTTPLQGHFNTEGPGHCTTSRHTATPHTTGVDNMAGGFLAPDFTSQADLMMQRMSQSQQETPKLNQKSNSRVKRKEPKKQLKSGEMKTDAESVTGSLLKISPVKVDDDDGFGEDIVGSDDEDWADFKPSVMSTQKETSQRSTAAGKSKTKKSKKSSQFVFKSPEARNTQASAPTTTVMEENMDLDDLNAQNVKSDPMSSDRNGKGRKSLGPSALDPSHISSISNASDVSNVSSTNTVNTAPSRTPLFSSYASMSSRPVNRRRLSTNKVKRKDKSPTESSISVADSSNNLHTSFTRTSPSRVNDVNLEINLHVPNMDTYDNGLATERKKRHPSSSLNPADKRVKLEQGGFAQFLKSGEVVNKKECPRFTRVLGWEYEQYPVVNENQLDLTKLSIAGSGLPMNSHWNEEDACCVQMLNCNVCLESGSQTPTAAVLVVCSAPVSRFMARKVWLNPEHVHTGI